MIRSEETLRVLVFLGEGDALRKLTYWAAPGHAVRKSLSPSKLIF